MPVTAARAALPAGFERVLHASGLHHGTAIAFERNRIFVARKEGTVRIVKADGTLRAKPYVTLHVSTNAERGLLGVAIDPKFTKNGFVYVYYTTGPGAKHYSGKPMNRVSRFTTKHGIGKHEDILLNNIPSDSGSHDGGDIHFGFDKKLYIAVGDGAIHSEHAELLDNLRGKILRINRNGAVPSDNPYYNTPNARPQIFASGFRNPFRFALRPFNRTYLVGDVGNVTWEELDTLHAGADYGWVRYEGPCPYTALDCDPTQTDFGTTTAPVYYYNHNQGAQNRSAIVAGAFPQKSNYPAPYNDAFFFGDWALGWIQALTFDDTNHVTGRYDFDTLPAPVSFATGPDGNIYVMDYLKGNIYKYIYTPKKIAAFNFSR
jgi:glucose/arabinose dehydrogenase